MAKHYDKQFKLDAVQYYHDHRQLGLQGCASNLGISQQTLSRWQKKLCETGDIESRDSGIIDKLVKLEDINEKCSVYIVCVNLSANFK